MSDRLPAPSTIVVLALVHRDLLGPAQVFERQILELDAQIFADQRAAGQDGDVAQQGLAAIAEARRLHRTDVERAAQLVHHQQRQGLGLHVLGDDQQRSAGLADLLQNRDQVANVADLLLVNQDERVFQAALHGRRIIDEVRGDEALVELHAVDVLDLRFGRLAFFDRDHAVLADAFERFGQQLADGLVVVGADRPDVGDFRLLGNRLGHFHQLGLGRVHGLLDAAPHARPDWRRPRCCAGLP